LYALFCFQWQGYSPKGRSACYRLRRGRLDFQKEASSLTAGEQDDRIGTPVYRM